MDQPPASEQCVSDRLVLAGVIGSGAFGAGIIAQASHIPLLEIPAVADKDMEAARRAYRRAGVAEDEIVACDSAGRALRAMESGKRVVTEDPMVLMELPIDVVVESTGMPEAAARHAYQAIRHGKHVAMVTKEADVVAGPILKHLADRAGVIYTAVDGDQHGLLMGLVAWARSIGLEVLCGGKARNQEFCYDPASQTVSSSRESLTIEDADLWMLEPIPDDEAGRYVEARCRKLAPLGRISSADLTELVIAANGTGLAPDVPSAHCPPLYTSEIAKVLSHEDDGGILRARSAIDAVTCLRMPNEPGLGGGVFIVLDAGNRVSRDILKRCGPVRRDDGSAVLLTRPYHLLGVETATTILNAALHQVASWAAEYLPRYDLVGRAARDLRAGEVIGGHGSEDIEALMAPAGPACDGAALPYHMAGGNPLVVDVPKATIITREMVAAPTDSVLWSLRAQQDERFLSERTGTSAVAE